MKRYRGAALCLALALSLTACGTKSIDSATSSATATATGEAQMGRWVENQLDIGEQRIAGGPTLLEDGSLVLYLYEEDPNTFEAGPLQRLTSTDNGETWHTEDTGWNDQVEGSVTHVWTGTDGTACVYSVVFGEDGRASNSYQIYLQKPGGSLEPISIDEMNSVYDAVFYQNDLWLFQISYSENGASSSLIDYNPETGSSQKITLDDTTIYGGGIQPAVAGDKLLYLYYAESSMPLMQLNPTDGTGTQVLENVSEAVSPVLWLGTMTERCIIHPPLASIGWHRAAPCRNRWFRGWHSPECEQQFPHQYLPHREWRFSGNADGRRQRLYHQPLSL